MERGGGQTEFVEFVTLGVRDVFKFKFNISIPPSLFGETRRGGICRRDVCCFSKNFIHGKHWYFLVPRMIFVPKTMAKVAPTSEVGPAVWGQ